MIIGCPKEIKDHEYRVGLTPAGAKRYIDAGHDILVESGAGDGSDISNDEYVEAGVVFVDVAIDQGGCAETSRPTTHSNPVYFEEGVLHYCVANMPGAYARTSTFALNNATIQFGIELANKGVEQACKDDPALKRGLNIYKGILTFEHVADTFSFQKFCKLLSEILS